MTRALKEVSGETTRRTFLLGGGVALLGGLAACTGSGAGPTDIDPPATSAAGTTAGGSRYQGDLKIAALSAALENLAVATYTDALALAGQHRLGPVPPAINSFFTTAIDHHRQHAATWNALLAEAKLPKVTGTPLTIAKPQLAALAKATSAQGVVRLALALEHTATQTYTSAVAAVRDTELITTAASIQPVEAMHVAVLGFLLGSEPVPSSFIGRADAVQPSALTA